MILSCKSCSPYPSFPDCALASSQCKSQELRISGRVFSFLRFLRYLLFKILWLRLAAPRLCVNIHQPCRVEAALAAAPSADAKPPPLARLQSRCPFTHAKTHQKTQLYVEKHKFSHCFSAAHLTSIPGQLFVDQFDDLEYLLAHRFAQKGSRHICLPSLAFRAGDGAVHSAQDSRRGQRA